MNLRWGLRRTSACATKSEEIAAPSSMARGRLICVIGTTPNSGDAGLSFGEPKIGVLVRLNADALNSNFCRSATANVRITLVLNCGAAQCLFARRQPRIAIDIVVLRVGLETRKRAVRAPRPIHPLSTTRSGLVNMGMAACSTFWVPPTSARSNRRRPGPCSPS